MTADAKQIGFVGADDVRELEELLHRLVDGARVRYTVAIDRAGRALAAAGEPDGLDQTAFASLAAADFAASDRLAALLGEDEFATLYHHGDERSMFLADIGGAAILAVLFDTRTTLGMVRILTRSLIPRLAACLDRLAERGPSGQVVQIEPDWAAEAESEIDRLFSE